MNEASSTIGSLAPWFGGKRTMAARIVEALGPHHSYWELFSGSMAVLLAKPQSRTEVVNDLHGDLVNLARCVQHPLLGPKLYRRLRRVLFCRDLFDSALEYLRVHSRDEDGDTVTPNIDRAECYFIASWQGMNGFSGTSKMAGSFAARHTSTGGDPAARWSGAVRSIPAWRRRLERVQVLRSDGIGLARKIEDRAGTVIYADPPYLVKGAKYLHDFKAEQHAELAEVLNRFRHTRVVVSYYDHPDLAALYPGWRVEPVKVAKSLVNQGKRDEGGATAAPEVLLINVKEER